MKKYIIRLSAILILLLFMHCSWNRYIAYPPPELPAARIALLYAPDDNLHIIDIDGRPVSEFGPRIKTLRRCIVEFMPGTHYLTLLCYRLKPDLIGNGEHAHRIIKKQPVFEAGHIYRLSAEIRNGRLDARIMDVTHIPKYQKVTRRSR